MNHPELILHDNTLDYIHPLQPLSNQEVSFSLRVPEKEVENAFLVWEGRRYPMEFEERHRGFDYFRTELTLYKDPFHYYFRIDFEDGQTVWYDKRGPIYSEPGPGDQGMSFLIIPDFVVPEWANGAVMYQIMVDRFCCGDPSNDVLDNEYHYLGHHVRRVNDWYEMPDPSRDYDEFYGGDLQGVLDKLEYLSDLGVEAIYFNPIFVSPSSHKYDTQDYDHVDPHLGRIVFDYGRVLTPEETDNRFATRYRDRVTHPDNLEASDNLFAYLVRMAHRNGIKVILDGVFNHCGSFNKWLDREGIYEGKDDYAPGAYRSSDSPYKDFFSFKEDNWPENASYEGWWGHDTLPKLNYEGSEKLQEYILRIARKWVSAPFYCDGWRLDVAADLGHSEDFNHEFWKKFRKVVKEANPNAVIIAEHYGNPRSWLLGDEWDTVMNYDAFMEPVTYFLTGMEKHSDEYHPEFEGNADQFWNTMRYMNGQNFTRGPVNSAMNELSNHDHSRFLTRTNHMVGRVSALGHEAASSFIRHDVFRQAVMIQFTWVGSPTIYYGDEAGVTGFTDPDNRRTYPWGREDVTLIDYHKELIRIRKECPELRWGSLRELYKEHGLLVYGRFTRQSACVVEINMNGYAIARDISLRKIGIPLSCTMRRLILTTQDGFSTDSVEYHVEDGMITVNLSPRSGAVLRYDAVRPMSMEEFWDSNFIDFSD